MKNVQQDALFDQALDIRAARTLCRDGWARDQINAVLKNADITAQQFETIQNQSRELDELQKVFGPPVESLAASHAEPAQSELDFLNRGPDAASAVLREKGWSRHEVSLVIQEAMFEALEEAAIATAPQTPSYSSAATEPPVPLAFPTQDRNGYALGHPNAAMAGTVPMYYAQAQALPRRTSRSSLSRDAFILTFMAGFALVLVFTLL